MISLNNEEIQEELDILKSKVIEFEEQIEIFKKYEDLFENFESHKFVPSSLETIKNIIEELDTLGIEGINIIMYALTAATEAISELDLEIGKGVVEQ